MGFAIKTSLVPKLQDKPKAINESLMSDSQQCRYATMVVNQEMEKKGEEEDEDNDNTVFTKLATFF